MREEVRGTRLDSMEEEREVVRLAITGRVSIADMIVRGDENDNSDDHRLEYAWPIASMEAETVRRTASANAISAS
jgi:hypothetical protein